MRRDVATKPGLVESRRRVLEILIAVELHGDWAREDSVADPFGIALTERLLKKHDRLVAG